MNVKITFFLTTINSESKTMLKSTVGSEKKQTNFSSLLNGNKIEFDLHDPAWL